MLLKQGKTYKQVKDLTGISKSTLNRARNVSVQEKADKLFCAE